ncbi:MAG: OmpA family protein [Cellvibrionaceae bacterium]|nr:OmpA family protein [Cellvibrionaceae bacterium]MCV6624976.1 OmpA family protein [Cellvibrionaceae bacterium]
MPKIVVAKGLRGLLVLALCLGLGVPVAQAGLRQVGDWQNVDFDRDSWRSEGSIFECRMSQMLPSIGQAVFYRRAGERQQFFLDTPKVFFKKGKASLKVTAPVWRPQGPQQDLGFVPVSESKRPLSLGAKLSERIMAELERGQQIVITRQPWYGAPQSLQVSFDSYNYRPVFQEYMGCVAGLLPVNFDQVEKTTLYFNGPLADLSEGQKSQLEQIVIYAKADQEVTGYYVDGHTDGRGTMAENLVLSQQRAQQVADYLTKSGLDSSKLQVRWHGERYPVKSNTSAKGRAANRRVTVRLERGGPMLGEKDSQPMADAPKSLDVAAR